MIKNPLLYVAAFGMAASAFSLTPSEIEPTKEITTTKVGTVSIPQCVKGRALDPSQYSFDLHFDLGVTSNSQLDYEKKIAYMQTKETTIKNLATNTAMDIGSAAKKGLKSGYDITWLFEMESVKPSILDSIRTLKANFSEQVGPDYVINVKIVEPKIGCP